MKWLSYIILGIWDTWRQSLIEAILKANDFHNEENFLCNLKFCLIAKILYFWVRNKWACEWQDLEIISIKSDLKYIENILCICYHQKYLGPRNTSPCSGLRSRGVYKERFVPSQRESMVQCSVGFRTWSIARNIGKTQSFGNWISFRSHTKGEVLLLCWLL
jgi:hypothetical protein